MCGQRRWRRCLLRTGGRASRRLGYVPGGAGANGAPSVALGHAAHDRSGGPEVGSDIYGNCSADNPFTALGRQVNTIMTNRATASWDSPRLGYGGSSAAAAWRRCRGRPCRGSWEPRSIFRPASMACRSVGRHRLSGLHTARRGRHQPSTGTTPEHLGYATVTIASRGLPQDGADLHVARARLEALGRVLSAGDTTLDDHVMESLRSPIARRTRPGRRLWSPKTGDLHARPARGPRLLRPRVGLPPAGGFLPRYSGAALAPPFRLRRPRRLCQRRNPATLPYLHPGGRGRGWRMPAVGKDRQAPLR